MAEFSIDKERTYKNDYFFFSNGKLKINYAIIKKFIKKLIKNVGSQVQIPLNIKKYLYIKFQTSMRKDSQCFVADLQTLHCNVLL